MSEPKLTNRRKHWWRMLLPGQKLILSLVALFLVLMLLVLGILISYTYRAAKFDIEKVVSTELVTTIYGYKDDYISSLSNVRYEPVTWNDLPQNLVNAFVAREDEDFFEHHGIVYSAIVRSVIKNVSAMRYEQGASTITMQLARNIYELQDKTLDRKFLEAFLARRIEDTYDKQTILTRYLNCIYYGQGCYGIGAAARYYFGKHVKDLSLVECAVIAGLVRGPSIFNPRYSMESAQCCKRETLERMRALGFITPEQCKEAIEQPIELADHAPMELDLQNYINQWVSREMRDIADLSDEKNVGLAIVSTFDLKLQQYVEEASEKALVLIEQIGDIYYPSAWDSKDKTPEQLKAARKYFSESKRPQNFKVRGDSNDLSDLLQCCVLVLDGRVNHAGEVLAVTSGRSIIDGKDRWLDPILPGRNFAPFLFCASREQKQYTSYIQTKNVQATGEKIGYDKVSEFFKNLQPDLSLPTADRAEDLYAGKFPVRRIDLARMLFALQNSGRKFDFYSVRKVWTRGRNELFSRERHSQKDYIHTQHAELISDMSPFVVQEKLRILHEPLPDQGGCWAMVSNRRGVCVFVWIGYDGPVLSKEDYDLIDKLIQRAALNLAKEVHAVARQYLVER